MSIAKTNLNPNWPRCDYWRATDTFTVWVLKGTVESNTYYGASKVYGNLYQQVAVSPSCEIHALPGGIFLVDPDGGLVGGASLSLDEKHPFEKRYFPREDEWPLDKLEPISEAEKHKVDYSNRPDGLGRPILTYSEVQAMGATLFGNSIDWVLHVPVSA